jgi:hypothetical protein
VPRLLLLGVGIPLFATVASLQTLPSNQQVLLLLTIDARVDAQLARLIGSIVSRAPIARGLPSTRRVETARVVTTQAHDTHQPDSPRG